jgi:hypothetical protein
MVGSTELKTSPNTEKLLRYKIATRVVNVITPLTNYA